MADNTLLSAAVGIGDSVATDDIGGVKYPRSKIVIGADGTNDGDVSSANPLPASLRSEQVDDAAFTPATSRVAMVGAEFDDTTPDSVDEGDGGALRMSARRELYSQIRDAAGNERGANVNASNQLAVAGPVTNAGTFVVQVDGSALTALQLIDDPVLTDDAAFTPATNKVMMAGFEFDDTLPDSVNEGDAGAARMSANRNIYVNIRDNAGNERGLNVDAAGSIAVTDGSGTLTVDFLGQIIADGTGELPTNMVLVGGFDSVNSRPIRVDSSGRPILGAGTNAIGKLATNSGVDIGDVDVTSVTPGTAASSLGKAEDAAHTSADVGVMALAVRQATATDLSAGATDGDYEPLQVDASGRLHVNAGTVTVASHAVTNAGTFVVQENGAALTALQLIDDAVYTDDAAFTPATSKILGIGFQADEASTDSVDEGDIGAARMTLDRKVQVSAELEGNSYRSSGSSLTPKFARINGSTSGDNTLVAAVASKKIRVLSLSIMSAGTVTVNFQTAVAGAYLAGPYTLVANTGISIPFCPYGIFETVAGDLLNMELNAAVVVGGHLVYVEV